MAVSQTLTLTEVAGSTNMSANTSKVRILWQSTQSGDSWNGYTRTAKYYISINGEAEREYTVSYTLPKTSTTTILDTTLTISHKGDGSGSVKVRTWMDTSISAGVVEKTQSLTLTTIPRASTITSASNTTLGTPCTIKWTPLSTAFRYKLKFTLGSYSYTTGVIHPNTTTAYPYTGYTPTIADVAPKITGNPPTGTMTVTLYTYSDSNATVQIGSASSTTFTVTVPENESTKPSVTMTLSPVTPYTKFASLYLQGRSKVKATFSGSGKYGADVTSYNMQVDGVGYASYTSDTLKKSGSVSVVGIAKDSRGFSGTSSQTINVIAYDAPYIAPSEGNKNVICERSTSDGVASDKGTYLHIKGTRNYTKINTGGIVNTCSIRCRYKPEGGSWSHDSGNGVAVLLGSDTSTDEIDVALPNIVSNIKLSYTVELNIVDDTNIPSTMVFNIPSERVDFDLREGGGGAAFGKHAIAENLFECEWDAQFNGVSYLDSLYLIEKEITVGGDKDTYYPVHIDPAPVNTNKNSQPAFLGIGRVLDSPAPNWAGNHSTANSSNICAAWLFRYMGWDGNGEFIIPLYKRENYAKLIAHIEGLNWTARGVLLYLRGGGATYNIVCSIPFTPKIYLTETNISDHSPETYPVMVAPRAYEGNYGINFSNGIVGDFVVEQGTTGIWTWRKWYSGIAECWGKNIVTADITTQAYESIYRAQIGAIAFPFAFKSAPTCQVTVETSNGAWSACNVRALAQYTPAVMVYRIGSIAAQQCDVIYNAIGRWK